MSQPEAANSAAVPYHVPVMAAEVVEMMRPLDGGIIVDATFGGGGHTRALLDALKDVRIVALDRDPDAAARAPSDRRVRFVRGRFSELGTIVGDSGPEVMTPGSAPTVSGVLFDLGVSSHQLDNGDRGFSFRQAGPLDMRMDPSSGIDAASVVNEWDESELRRALRQWGEEPNAGRIARAIVQARPIGDTRHLAEVVSGAMPAAVRRRRHPARRTFQAIRMAVNDETAELQAGLDEAIRLLAPGGRVVVITYHSIEDRIVVRRFRAGTAGCECPPGLPVCACGKTAELRSLTSKAITPSELELEENPRSRSARLRAAEKVERRAA